MGMFDPPGAEDAQDVTDPFEAIDLDDVGSADAGFDALFDAPEENYIDAVFGANGYLSQRFAGYQPRPGQIALARAVDAALTDGAHLMGEAGTGVGKSIGYSVPAIHHAIRTGERIVIVTANIALQEQIVNKDLPMLTEVLPWKGWSFALLKGRNNFLCLDKAYEAEAKGDLAFPNGLDEQGRKHLKIVQGWWKATETGDASELPFEANGEVWRAFSAGSDECKGKDCEFADACHSRRAREAANEAQIIVTNYHMLFAHLSVRMMTGADVILPEFTCVIADEGHKAPEIARDFFGFKISAAMLKRFERPLREIQQGPVADELARQAQRFFSNMREVRTAPTYKARIRHERCVASEQIRMALQFVGDAFSDHAREIAKVAKDEHGVTTIEDLPAKERSKIATWTRRRDRVQEIDAQIDRAMNWQAEDRSVFFIDLDPRDNVSLCSRYVHVGPILEKALFEPARSVVMTSATLSTNGRFRWIANEAGMPAPYRELIAESPFSWRDQAILVVPEDVPEPNAKEYVDAVAALAIRTIELAQGRTLLLFTSRRSMLHTADKIACTELRGRFRILKQGDMPRSQLIETFKRDVNSVLLGLESFWAGVDVPGESLSCVLIDRLPFPTPDDPVLSAIQDVDPDWFMHHAVPRSIIAFKQGFGRLIRTTSDRGAVVVVDPRIVTKRYGSMFTASLPPVRKSRKMESIREFVLPPTIDTEEDVPF